MSEGIPAVHLHLIPIGACPRLQGGWKVKVLGSNINNTSGSRENSYQLLPKQSPWPHTADATPPPWLGSLHTQNHIWRHSLSVLDYRIIQTLASVECNTFCFVLRLKVILSHGKPLQQPWVPCMKKYADPCLKGVYSDLDLPNS